MNLKDPMKFFYLLLEVTNPPWNVMEIRIQKYRHIAVGIGIVIRYPIIIIADTLTILGDCERAIVSSCTVPDLPGNQTLNSLDECKDSAGLFRKEFRECAEILDNTKRCDCLNNMKQIN